MKKLLAKADHEKTGVPELHDILAKATTEDMRGVIQIHEFDTETQLTLRLVSGMLWHVDAAELAAVTGISLDATRAIQELMMREIVPLVKR